MFRKHSFFAVFLVTALTGSAIAAPATRQTRVGSIPKGAGVTDHLPQIDGTLKTLTGPDGRGWAAWAYRSAGEFDIAVSSRDASTSTWSAPLFFGRRNGADELDPTIAIDSHGAVYLAFATTNPARVSVAVLPAGSLSWSEPVIVSGTEAATSPALLVVGDRLVVAYRTASGVALVDIPIVGSGNQVNGIEDGPNGVDPLGVRGHGSRTDSTPTAGASNRNP